MPESHLVITATSPEDLSRMLAQTLTGQGGQALYDPARDRHCPGPAHPNIHSAVVQLQACAKTICSNCDEEICAGCGGGIILSLDTGRTQCGPCSGGTVWQFLAALSTEKTPRTFTVVDGCFSCGGSETPERTATMMYTQDSGNRAMHWLCRSCVRHHGPEKALSQLTQRDMHPDAQPVFNGSSPAREATSLCQGPQRAATANPA